MNEQKSSTAIAKTQLRKGDVIRLDKKGYVVAIQRRKWWQLSKKKWAKTNTPIGIVINTDKRDSSMPGTYWVTYAAGRPITR